MPSRKNQKDLTTREWDSLITAMQAMKKSKARHNWDFFTETHRKYAKHDKNTHDLPHHDGDDLHIHSPIYWLPWHRKFIREFESELQKFDAAVTLPYWDWTTDHVIPARLQAKFLGWMKVLRGLSHQPDKLPTADAPQSSVMDKSDFPNFDFGLANLHNQVHEWIGGAMGNPNRSPADPLFFLHHAFIDKVWVDWQATHPDKPVPAEYLDFTLPPWNCTVRDVLDIAGLDYDYR